MCEVAMATDIDTLTLDNIAMVMDNMMGGSDHWRPGPLLPSRTSARP